MPQQTLHELLQDLEQELLRLGYTEGSMTFYRNRWRKLEEYAVRCGQVYYTEQFGIDFVQEYFGIPQDDFSGDTGTKHRHRTSVSYVWSAISSYTMPFYEDTSNTGNY